MPKSRLTSMPNTPEHNEDLYFYNRFNREPGDELPTSPKPGDCPPFNRDKALARLLSIPSDWEKRLKDKQQAADLIISMLPDETIAGLRKLKAEGSLDESFGGKEFWDGLLIHTVDHVDCPACQAAEKIVQADLLSMAGMPFPLAAQLWLAWRRNDKKLRERTHETSADYVRSLGKFFGKIVLSNITAGMLRAYQAARQSNQMMAPSGLIKPWAKTASNGRINYELNTLSQILRGAIYGKRSTPSTSPAHFPLVAAAAHPPRGAGGAPVQGSRPATRKRIWPIAAPPSPTTPRQAAWNCAASSLKTSV